MVSPSLVFSSQQNGLRTWLTEIQQSDWLVIVETNYSHLQFLTCFDRGRAIFCHIGEER